MKTILITGASSGIGKECARLFHERGWNVAATMRSPEKESELNTLPNAACFPLDITDSLSIKHAIQAAINRFEKIDVIVNNAAYNLTGPFEAAEPGQIQDMYDVNVFGLMNVTREILPYFREIRNGVIINISSLAGVIGVPMSSFYGSSKWAVEGFSESLMYEAGEFNVKVRLIQPGGIKTNFAANAVIVRKDDVAQYKNFMDNRIASYEKRKDKLNHPGVVAKVVYKAATDSGNRLRYIAGRDGKLLWTLRSLLPFGMFTSLLKKVLAG